MPILVSIGTTGWIEFGNFSKTMVILLKRMLGNYSYPILLLMGLSIHSFGQSINGSKMSVLEAFELVLLSKDSIVDLRGFNIMDSDEEFSEYLSRKYHSSPLLKMEKSFVIIDKEIWLGSASFSLKNIRFNQMLKIGEPNGVPSKIKFTNCSFENDLSINGESATFVNCILKANLFCFTNHLVGKGNVSFDSFNYSSKNEGSVILYENTFMDTLLIDGRLKSLEIFNNTFKGDLDLSQIEPLDKFYLQQNIVQGKIVFSEFALPPNSVIHWDLKPNQLSYALPEKNDTTVWNAMFQNSRRDYVNADNPAIFESQFLFLGLNALHKKFYNYFLSRGDIESANSCYREMKDIETTYNKKYFLQHGGFRNFLKWGLNWIIKIYTSYGTDPSLAILASTYVILLFALIFFFFPSEWDTESHVILKQHLAEFKNSDFSFVKKIFLLIIDLLSAILISVTLSLNSFITIGFGNIPTKGLARYACIIEGTLGWFLLTLFSVALISQLVY